MDIFNITDNVKKVFNTTKQFNLISNYKYYCISNKERISDKCASYSSYNLNYINSTLDIGYYYDTYNFIIIDTDIPQILMVEVNNLYPNFHVIGLENSDVTFYPNYQPRNGDFYVILNSDSIAMPNFYFEGKGHLTLATSGNISLLTKTRTNNNHFTLKAKHPFVLDESYIYSIDGNSNINFINKIHIAQYCYYVIPEQLLGLFEQGKYYSDTNFNYDLTVDQLKEYQYDYVTYYFRKGDHEIPSNWKKSCRFQGIDPEETNFIFSDVHSYDGRTIDNFIDVNYKPSKSFNKITIKPSSYLYLDSFGSIYNPEFNEQYTIVVEKDFFMYGPSDYYGYDDDEISKQCKIVGSGTVKFIDSAYMQKIRKYCEIDNNIHFELDNLPTFQVCIGQENIDKCKSEIINVGSDPNWIWLRNIKTLRKISYYQSPIYITDDQTFYDYDYNNIILTSNANLLIPYNGQFSLYKNGINNIKAQSPRAKLTIFFNYSYYNYDYISYSKSTFHIYYNEAPTDIDFEVYFHFENTKLYMKYMRSFSMRSIKLTGKTVIYYREPHTSQISIFQRSDNIKFELNTDKDYDQILFADQLIESDSLYDFVFAKNIDEFNELNYRYATAYIYKDISISLNISNYFSRSFMFYGSISVTIDLPNNTYFLFDSNQFKIVIDRYTYHILNYLSSSTKFTFIINNFLNLDFVYLSEDAPKISFVSSQNSVELFPSQSVKRLHSEFDYTISVPNGFTIYSPVPSYLTGLFDSAKIEYSSRWSYLYLSDTAKNTNEPFQLITHQNFENEEKLPQDFVLMIDPNDKIEIPRNWQNIHNIYYQGEDRVEIGHPTNITYQLDGIVLNNLFRIVAGDLNIIVPSSFTINTDNLYTDCTLNKYMYDSILNCSHNSHTDLYVSPLYYSNTYQMVKITGNNYNRSLYINVESEDDLYYFNRLFYLESEINVKYILDYQYICYDTNHFSSVCTGKYFHATGIESLLTTVKDYPDLPITVVNDLTIPYSTGDHLTLLPINQNIRINLPYSPRLMTIIDNENIQFHYSDSTLIEILNKSKIDVNLNRPLKLDVKSGTSSSITFNLDSDVLLSTDKSITENLNIQVTENSYQLYSENINRFGMNFNGKLHQYYKICAYNSNAGSLCTFSDKNTIDNVFGLTDDFKYNEVEFSLSTNPQKIVLPSIQKQVALNILPSSSSTLTIKKVTSLEIESDLITINDYWRFQGDLSRLYIELDAESSLSITGKITNPIALKLSSTNTIIDLYDCDEQNNPFIRLFKFGNDANSIKVLGSEEIFHNLEGSIIESTKFTFGLDNRQKYLCLCIDDNSYNKCQQGIDGIIKKWDVIRKDPGRDVQIRVFSNVEIKNNVFKKEHDVFLNYECQVNLTRIKTVYQNIDKGLKIEKLIFRNGTNILLKPRENVLNIYMKEFTPGPYFSIDIDKYLSLKVPNIGNENSAASRLHVGGKGELNVFDYPFDKINRLRLGDNIKLIKGIYVICGSRNGDSICSYESDYKKIDNYADFDNSFDTNSKIVVLLNSLSNNMDVRLNRLNHQSIQFIRTTFSKNTLQSDPVKLRFLSTNELVGKAESEIDLSNSFGGVSLNSSDSDLFVVGFDDTLTIKQEDSISHNLNGIVIQPSNDKVTINIDESVDLEKQKLKIETENNKPISITIVSNNKNIDQSKLNGLFDFDPKSVVIEDVIYDEEPDSKPKSASKKNKLTTTGIVAIVVVAAVIVIVAFIGVIFAVREKKKGQVENSCKDISE